MISNGWLYESYSQLVRMRARDSNTKITGSFHLCLSWWWQSEQIEIFK